VTKKSPETNIRKLAEQMAKFTGQSVEEILKTLPAQEEVEVVPDIETSVFQAQAVLNYFSALGNGFYHRPCKICDRIFAYSYSYPGIKTCSVECMKEDLARIGIEWDPEKPLRERWNRIMPAIVPPEALELLQKVEHQEVCPKWLAEKAKDKYNYDKEREEYRRNIELLKRRSEVPVTEANNEEAVKKKPKVTKPKPQNVQSYSESKTSEKAHIVQPPKKEQPSLEDLDELLGL